jgi:predicted extracellular nuclease
VSLNLRVPTEKRYSYVFDAQAGYLDHALATPKLAERITGVAKWHINSDEPQIEDTRSNATGATPFGSSDHDPLIVGLRLDQ